MHANNIRIKSKGKRENEVLNETKHSLGTQK